MVEAPVSGTLETMSRWKYNLYDNRPLLLAEQVLSQSIANSTFVTVSFSNTVYDNYGAFSGTNTYTVPLAGTYRVGASVHWTGNATPARAIQVLRNGSSAAFTNTNDNCSTSITTSSLITSLIQCNVGDTLVIRVDQNSGGALSTQAGTAGGIAYNSWFGLTWLCS